MNSEFTIVSVVGARPQFVKLAPVSKALDVQQNVVHRIVHTGQHYDEKMSDSFFGELNIPEPDVNLGIGSASQATQTAGMLEMLESNFEQMNPQLVLAYGDTNSTLAAVLSATKLHIPVAHIEAGLRSFNRKMPEEINRLVADHCSDRLYAPTATAMHNLAQENLQSRAVNSGDVMCDAVKQNLQLAHDKSKILERLGLQETEFGVLTLHRASNTLRENIATTIEVIDRVAKKHNLPLVFPVHPRTRSMIDVSKAATAGAIIPIEPVAYLDMLSLVEAAKIVLTDSGGLQKEAAFLHTPCVTLRTETEWTETVDLGVNVLAGTDESVMDSAMLTMLKANSLFDQKMLLRLQQCYGNGTAANQIAEDIFEQYL